MLSYDYEDKHIFINIAQTSISFWRYQRNRVTFI